MTVYKDTNLEAKAASDLAIALINGDTAGADALATGTVDGHRDASKDGAVRARHPGGDLPGQRQDVIADGFQPRQRRLHRRVRQGAARSTAFSKPARRGPVRRGPGPDARSGPDVARRDPLRGPHRPITSDRTARPAPAPTGEPLLTLRGINKSFGAVHVLRGVDLDVRLGQVTALVGDNGAGKSTLIKGIAGIYAFDAGEYHFEGKPVHVHSPKRRPTRSASRSSTRTSRCATTSTSCTTCSSAAS